MLQPQNAHMLNHVHTPRVSFQLGIKIHVENAVGCVGVHGLSCTIQQLFVFANEWVL